MRSKLYSLITYIKETQKYKIYGFAYFSYQMSLWTVVYFIFKWFYKNIFYLYKMNIWKEFKAGLPEMQKIFSLPKRILDSPRFRLEINVKSKWMQWLKDYLANIFIPHISPIVLLFIVLVLWTSLTSLNQAI